MPSLPGFAGGSDVLGSDLACCALSLNLRPESTGPEVAKRKKWLPRTPGLRYITSVADSGVQVLFYLDGRAFGVAGTTFFEFMDDETYLVLGTVAAPTFAPATMASGGSASDQVMVTAGGNGYVLTLSTNAFAQITAMDFPTGDAVMCEFFAGYYLVQVVNSRTIQWSALEDATSWDALDVYERSWAGDNISFIKRSGTHIWVVGTQTAEVLYATGGIEVFAPAQESLIEHGCIAPFSGHRFSGGVIWLDQDERGAGQVVVAKGLSPETISTYSISHFEQSAGIVMGGGRSFVVQMDGHVDYVLNNGFEPFRMTPVFDVTEGLWHHRAHWNPVDVQLEPWRASCHMAAFGKHYVGDRETGAIYELSMSQFTDEIVAV